MDDHRHAPDIAAGRLDAETLARNFADTHPPLSTHEALVAADRCYFCHDAPCVTACPTEIDIPLFIRQIAVGRPKEAARTIFDQNILGGMCARVCPTETLCEEACVREMAEGRPVEIGRLQRHATDAQMATGRHPYARAAPTGKRIAVVGAGPAGLACAHRLAMKGHEVDVFDAREKPGGLNEYGIAAYKTVADFAQAEIDWLLKIGGIEIHHGIRIGTDRPLSELVDGHDAVFVGIGNGASRRLGVPGEDLAGIEDATGFIETLRQTPLDRLAVGREVVVIGGGMTAIDAAVQSRLLGAETVTLAYRGPRARMKASAKEQDRAATAGVRIVTDATPVRFEGSGHVTHALFAKGGEEIAIPADQVFRAIGQDAIAAGFEPIAGAAGAGRTAHPKLWTGGDCAPAGEDLTVTAVAQGRDAAEDIHRTLTA